MASLGDTFDFVASTVRPKTDSVAIHDPLAGRKKLGCWIVSVIVLILILVSILPVFASTLPLLPLWAVVTALIGAFVVFAGLAVTGLYLGFAIDGRNRVSLSRLQMAIWTILFAGTLFAAFYWNVMLADSGEDLATALDVEIPPVLLALLGIPAGALVGAPLIRSFKTTSQPDTEETDRTLREIRASDAKLRGGQSTAGQIVVNDTPMDARLSDIFRGEETGNAAKSDIGKIQMALFTVVAWLAFAFVVGAHLNKHTAPDLENCKTPNSVECKVKVESKSEPGAPVAERYVTPSSSEGDGVNCKLPKKSGKEKQPPKPSVCTGLKVRSIPDIAQGMIWILLVSHGGYLTAKAVPNSRKGGGPSTPGGGGGRPEARLVLRGRR